MPHGDLEENEDGEVAIQRAKFDWLMLSPGLWFINKIKDG
jgi:hypothetical protein